MNYQTKLIFKKLIWNIVPIVLVILLVKIFVLRIIDTEIRLDFSKMEWQYYPKYIYETLKIAFLSSSVGFIIGFPLGIGAIQKDHFIRVVSRTIMATIRGIPLIVLIYLFFVFFYIALRLDRYAVGVIVLGIYASFRVADNVVKLYGIFRENNKIQSSHKNWLQFRLLFLVFSYNFVHLIKESSLLSFIAVPELYYATRKIAVSYGVLEAYFMVAFVYCVLVLFSTRILKTLRSPKFLNLDEYYNSPLNVNLW